jgi:hypothetical protein
MPGVRRLRHTVERLVDQDADMTQVEAMVSRWRLREEQRAALWLYAHALRCRRDSRPRNASPVPPASGPAGAPAPSPRTGAERAR